MHGKKPGRKGHKRGGGSERRALARRCAAHPTELRPRGVSLACGAGTVQLCNGWNVNRSAVFAGASHLCLISRGCTTAAGGGASSSFLTLTCGFAPLRLFWFGWSHRPPVGLATTALCAFQPAPGCRGWMVLLIPGMVVAQVAV